MVPATGNISNRRPKKALALAAVLAFLLAFAACRRPPENPVPQGLAPLKTGPSEAARPAPAKKEDEPQVRIKREKGGKYTWEITGRDVTRILQADRRLRGALKDDSSAGKE